MIVRVVLPSRKDEPPAGIETAARAADQRPGPGFHNAHPSAHERMMLVVTIERLGEQPITAAGHRAMQVRRERDQRVVQAESRVPPPSTAT
jgi:hypothetical protein